MPYKTRAVAKGFAFGAAEQSHETSVRLAVLAEGNDEFPVPKESGFERTVLIYDNSTAQKARSGSVVTERTAHDTAHGTRDHST